MNEIIIYKMAVGGTVLVERWGQSLEELVRFAAEQSTGKRRRFIARNSQPATWPDYELSKAYQDVMMRSRNSQTA